MNAAEIKVKLNDRVLDVCEHLLPGGKKKGNEWCIGGLGGEAGESLKVHVGMGKAGVWQDFATGDKGDLFDLWQKTKGIPFIDAIREVRIWLGIPEDKSPFAPAKAKPYTPPSPQFVKPIAPENPVYAYLTNDRKLDPEVLKRYKVGHYQHPQHGMCVSFPCTESSGKVLELIKFLAVARVNGEKMIHSTKDSRPHLFGWQGIDRNKREVYITEGEIDCLTLASWGFNALSLHSGVKNLECLDNDYDALEMLERIYVCTDMDDPGNACAAEIARRLGRERCYRVELPYKDANEAHLSGRFLDVDFQDCVDRSKTLDPGELRGIMEFAKDGWEAMHPTTQATIGTEPPIRLPWRCRFGEVSIWSGFSGSGKTIALNNFVIHDAAQGEKVCLASLEMPAPVLTASFVKLALGGAPNVDRRDRYDNALSWLADKIWIVNKVGVMHWTKILPILEYAAKRYGCTRFVIDSLVRLGIKEDDYEGQKEAVGAIVEFAAKYGHVHLVCHSRKKEDEGASPSKLDVRGSSTITDLVHNGFTVWRNKAKEQQMEEFANGMDNPQKRAMLYKERDATISMWKERMNGQEPWRNVWFHPKSGQYLDSPTDNPRVYAMEIPEHKN